MSTNEICYTYYPDQEKINDDYLRQKGSYQDDNLTIIKHDPNSQTRKMVSESGNSVELINDTTPEYKEIGQFLYMDVGRWGGDKDTGDAWTRRRNFGLLCGSGAILCNYDGKKGSTISKYPNLENIYPEVWKHPDIQKMEPLLKKLSESDSLGHVTVVNALVCTDEASESPSSDKILVFLGDIHAPVMNIHDRTYLPDSLINKSFAGSRENIEAWSRGRIKINHEFEKIRLIEKNVAIFLKKTDTLGPEPKIIEIITLLETLLKEIFENSLKETEIMGLLNKILGKSFESQQFNSLGNKKITWNDESTIKALKIILELLLESQQLDKWDNNEKIEEKEALCWFDLYHGDEINRGVDIFQNAGGDLCEFLKLLSEYQKNSHSKQGLISAKLVQLGDLYDFWLGLKRAFDTMDPQKMFSDNAAKSFLEFWGKETVSKTSVSAAICQLLTGTEDPKFVYGNHDNYRATSQWPYEEVLEHFAPAGIWAEHGHQSDAFNEDLNAVIGWSAAVFGFFDPDARNLEPYLRGAETWAFRELCRRLTCIRHAACQCQMKNKRIYVMGHTHEPLLKKVHIVE